MKKLTRCLNFRLKWPLWNVEKTAFFSSPNPTSAAWLTKWSLDFGKKSIFLFTKQNKKNRRCSNWRFQKLKEPEIAKKKKRFSLFTKANKKKWNYSNLVHSTLISTKKKLIRLNSTKTSFYVTLRKVFEQAKEASFLFNNKLGFSKTKQKQRGTFSAVKRLPQNCWLASRLFRWKKMVLEIVSFLFLNLPFFFILAFVTKQISFFPTSFFLLATLNKVKSARLALVCFLYSQ